MTTTQSNELYMNYINPSRLCSPCTAQQKTHKKMRILTLVVDSAEIVWKSLVCISSPFTSSVGLAGIG
jgi:hypothetical protein